MINKYTYKKLTWVDLQAPTSDEVRQLMEEYTIPGLIAEELLVPTLKPKVDIYPNSIYLILHFPHLKKNSIMHETNQEIDFIIGKNFIITSHYDPIESLSDFSKIFEVNSILDRSDMGDHAGYIFYYMLRKLYRHLLDELEYLTADLSNAENKIFHGEEKQMVYRLSEINRDILTFREAITLHREVLSSFEIAGKQFFGEKFSYHLRDIIGEYYKVQNGVQNSKDFLEELRTTNDSLLSTKQNEIMKNLTIMASIFLPVTFIGQLFSMSFRYTPFINDVNGFWFAILGMFFVGIVIFSFFKYKKWL